ncbi:hypothetical protein JCM14720_16410 [Calditerricola yamamurae]
METVPNYRIQRLAERIKEELSDILQRELKDPRLGFVSITDVELTRDLQVAKVYVSVLGSEEEKAKSLETLQRAKGFLRTEIGRRIQMRHVPDLLFKFDTSIEHGARVHELLLELERKGELGQDGEGAGEAEKEERADDR